jgi:ubiquinone/menaquinone biosynthesis C-methylase UbiE
MTVSARRPDAELPFDGPSSAAYDGISDAFFFRAERWLFMRELKQYRPAGTLLDIGCGPGNLLREISNSYPEMQLVGLDISPEMIVLAEKRLPRSVKLVCADAARTPLQDDSIDFIISSGALHHWQDAGQVFSEVQRVLAPGGRFLLLDLRRDPSRVLFGAAKFMSVFMPRELKRTRGVMGSLEAAYTPEELKNLLDNTPLDNRHVTAGPVWIFASGSKPRFTSG